MSTDPVQPTGSRALNSKLSVQGLSLVTDYDESPWTPVIKPGAEWIKTSERSITVYGATASALSAYPGAQINLKRKELSGTQIFVHWETQPEGLAVIDNTLIMPDCDVVLKAIFRDPGNEDIPIVSEAFGPDNCLSWLSENADNDGDGYLNLAERKAVLSIDIQIDRTDGLTGLRYFPKLKSLKIYAGNIGEPLDISAFSELEFIKIVMDA